MRHLIVMLAIAAFITPSLSSAQNRKTRKSQTTSAPAATQTASEASEAEASSPRRQRQSLHDQISGQGYGAAGCGLGSLIFGPKQGMVQVIASTTNGIYSNQTFGITSGTSNCDIPSSAHQAAVFIEVNREILVKDAARGQGETVAGLAYILGCSNATDFGQSLRANFDKVFVPENDSMMATRAILSTIQSDEKLNSSCRIDG